MKKFIEKEILENSKSKEEDGIFEKLIKIYDKNDIIRQYKSDVYPFPCDFYVISKDLYIEYQGYWTHGKEPFDSKNEQHIKILNKWNEKYKQGKTQYKSAINSWTKRDPYKLDIAIKNNLNIQLIYNKKERNK